MYIVRSKDKKILYFYYYYYYYYYLYLLAVLAITIEIHFDHHLNTELILDGFT